MTDCNVISHRGANMFAPQNTLAAFRKSIEIGCDGFETDVHLTKDGVPVICHNFTVDEMSNGTGAIKDKTLEELQELDFGSYRGDVFKGTRIPTLEEFLTLCETMADKMKVLDIELKSEKFGETGPEIAQKTIEAVKAHGLFDQLLISSFDPALLVICKKIDPKCKTGLLYSPEKAISLKIAVNPVKFAQEIGADALHPIYLYVSRAYVDHAHEAGIEVNPWTVDKITLAQKLAEDGVDGIITNCPDVINHALGKGEEVSEAPTEE